VSLILPDRILTGDALFLDEAGAGRDDLPGGDPIQHWESLERFKILSGDLIVYPAHDYRNRKPSSLGNQKNTNPFLKKRTREEFISYIEDLRLGPADWMRDVLEANYACARDPRVAWVPVDLPACEIKGTLELGVNEITVDEITPHALHQKLEKGENIALLDVREKKELTGELGHLDTITHISIGDLTRNLMDLEKYKNGLIVTVCRSGARAYTAAQVLKQAGFPQVRVLAGGMIAWRQTLGERNT
jgi:rhodanese-related sulfurtransferase